MVYIEENISDQNFSIEMLAQSVFISRTQLFRKMKAITGQSPNEFVRNIKLERAYELQKKEKYSNSELADMMGFKDEKYFKKILKDKFVDIL